MSFVLGQHTAGTSAATTTHAKSYAGATTAGRLLIAQFRVNLGKGAVTGPSGWTKAIDVNDAGASFSMHIFYKIASGSETSVTFTTSSNGNGNLQISEWSGNAAASVLDGTNTGAPAGTGTSVTGGSITPSIPDCLMITAAGVGSAYTVPAIDSSYSLLDTSLLTTLIPGYKIESDKTAENPTSSWSTPTSTRACVHAAFRPAVTSVSDTESTSGADTNSATAVTTSSSDTASDADTDISTAVTTSSSDVGAGTDDGAPVALIADAETSTDADANFATAVTLSSSETASDADTDASTAVSLSSSESVVVSDANLGVAGFPSSAETASVADADAATAVSLASAEVVVVTDSGALLVLRSSSDIAAGSDLPLSVVVIDAPRPSIRRLVLATDALLAMTAGQRAESVQFVVLDGELNTVGWLHPARDGMTVTHDATRTLTRTLEGLFLRWDQIGDLDTLVHRIRPEWVLQNGVTFPLGVFVFAHDPRSRHARGADIHASLVDQSSLLEQSDGLPVSYPVGTNVGDAIAAEWRGAGFSQFSVDSTTATIAGPLAWAPAATRGQRMRDLSALAGFLPPYFDNNGRGVSRTAPDLSILAAQFRYLRGTTIDRDSIVEDDDRLEASNRYVVVSTSGSDAPIVGKYDLPDSVPWCAARRHAVITKVVTMQGITDSVQAASIAKSIAMSDPSLFTRVDFDAAADPRHDSWDVLTYDGTSEELAYLETGWRLELRTGGRHHHSARRSLVDV